MISSPSLSVLDLASLGWHLVPIRAREKNPGALLGKDWVAKASCDATSIRNWATRWPQSNYGLLLGPKSGLIDLEYDTEEGKQIIEDACKDITTLAYRSAKSVHRLFLYDERFRNEKSKQSYRGTEWRFGQDVAQSVIPPSMHESGIVYEWLPGCSPSEIRAIELPTSLWNLYLRFKREEQQQTQVSQIRFVDAGRLDVEQWLKTNNIDVLERSENGSTQIWYIQCPRIRSHTTRDNDRDCAVFQDADGKLGGKCFHSSCGIHNWESLKTAIGPLRRDHYTGATNGSIDRRSLVAVEKLRPTPIRTLWSRYPYMRPSIINGLLRRGETCNIIASPKMGKSFLAGGLAWSIATGQPWLGFDTEQGRVLIVDNELHPETLSQRLANIASAMMIDGDHDDGIDVLSMRGVALGIRELADAIDSQPGTYSMVIIDALYRMLPDGTSENDNAQMMAVYNSLDGLARALDVAIVCVHHSSKGDQSTKSITDMGSGAGSISRAADTHLVIRPHEEPGYAVLEAVTRSWVSPEPVTIRWEYPLWLSTTKEAQVMQTKPSAEVARQRRNTESDTMLLETLQEHSKSMSAAEIRGKLGWGTERIISTLHRLKKSGRITSKQSKSKQTGKTAERFAFVGGSPDGSPEKKPSGDEVARTTPLGSPGVLPIRGDKNGGSENGK